MHILEQEEQLRRKIELRLQLSEALQRGDAAQSQIIKAELEIADESALDIKLLPDFMPRAPNL